MEKMSKRKFLTTSFVLIAIFTLLWAVLLQVKLWGDTGVSGALTNLGAFHIVVNIIAVIGILFFTISLINEGTEKRGTTLYKHLYRDPATEKDEDAKPFSFGKKWIAWGILLIFVVWFWGFGKGMLLSGAKMYNQSKLLHNAYTQKVEEKAGFYDKLWKTYLQKEKITNVNKETFIQVTKIIMENRKDGQNLTWKWVQENQQIPYGEFTKFYADLSDFITSQREGYFNIEKECQLIANRNNTLLDTFPNNIYNKVIGCERIKFEYGLLSDSTNNVIKSKIENVK